MNLSTSYHPQADGKTERINQVIEDKLRMYVMDQPSKWEYYLCLVEFACNNSYHASLKMSPFEALYGRKCNTPISWNNPIDKVVFGLVVKGNGRIDVQDQTKYKGNTRQAKKLCKYGQNIKRIQGWGGMCS